MNATTGRGRGPVMLTPARAGKLAGLGRIVIMKLVDRGKIPGALKVDNRADNYKSRYVPAEGLMRYVLSSGGDVHPELAALCGGAPGVLLYGFGAAIVAEALLTCADPVWAADTPVKFGYLLGERRPKTVVLGPWLTARERDDAAAVTADRLPGSRLVVAGGVTWSEVAAAVGSV